MLLFSHSGHPANQQVLIPMLQQIYAELGFTLNFQEAEGARAIKLLNDGLTDGDVARVSPLLTHFAQGTEAIWLDTVHIILYCRMDMPCDAEVVANRKAHILVPTHDSTLNLLTSEIKAKLYFNNDWQQIITLFDAGKIDYLLWPKSQLLQGPGIPDLNWAATNIGPFQLYHLIHPRHQALAQQVKKLVTLYLNHNVEPQAHGGL